MNLRNDHYFMAMALRLAGRGMYTTMPNPRVGCVLVRDGDVVGEGWHEAAGQAHAESRALAAAGARARGATAYVTLEPCSHHGRTGPCADALIAAGVARVVVAMIDPNPLVAGAGAARLRDAGIQVDSGLLEEQAASLNPGFIRRMRDQRPYVRCKMAMSLDGRTAKAGGESRWITGDAARLDVQRLRARSCAIMTGIDTVLADDPSLTVRWQALAAGDCATPGNTPARQPLRVVVDTNLRLSPTARLLGLPGKTLVATATEDCARYEALARSGARVACFPLTGAQVDLSELLRYLAEQGMNEILLEAGATLAGAMLQRRLIDEFVIYVAPVLMGSDARALFNLPGLAAMADNIALAIRDIRKVGDDWRVSAFPAGV
ncbi:MAG: riboflavin biosynthesis protein RibD [Gammaproteobacteria bacterium]|nr:MAG: riboflavin biosynthesis protein RibD [Gammaproteobacteria bacterium]TND07351.1 MAG: riboflavin biosynthesis protein RibD [Gammaproteobacteria bacterium]